MNPREVTKNTTIMTSTLPDRQDIFWTANYIFALQNNENIPEDIAIDLIGRINKAKFRLGALVTSMKFLAIPRKHFPLFRFACECCAILSSNVEFHRLAVHHLAATTRKTGVAR